jgi:hypothetical protein
MAMIKEAIMNSQAEAIGIPDIKHVEPNHNVIAENPTSITVSLIPPNKKG